MFVRKPRIALILCGVMLCLSPLSSLAKSKQRFTPTTPLTAEQAALVDKALAREKITIKELQKRAPIVQTYIQNMKPDTQLYAVPVSDDYIISRVDFGKTFNAKDFQEKGSKKGFFKGSMKALTGLGKALHFENEYVSTGFMDMMFIDPVGFDKQHYDFSFARREFLGTVRTVVFDVSICLACRRWAWLQ